MITDPWTDDNDRWDPSDHGIIKLLPNPSLFIPKQKKGAKVLIIFVI